MKPRAKHTLPPELVNRLAALNATFELMNPDERLELISKLAAEMVESLPLWKRLRIKVKMFFVRWRLWLLYYIKGEV